MIFRVKKHPNKMPKKAKVETPKVEQITDNTARLTAVKIAMQQITKQFGDGAIMRMGASQVNVKMPVISSGALSLDLHWELVAFQRAASLKYTVLKPQEKLL